MDESRKQFEQYAAGRLGLPLEMISDARNGDRYMHAFDSMSVMQPINGWWTLWQESRSAIEIELLADKRRMDWLVSKAVNVRDPMVYGSHSMFWSQAITDEEDDYYETKLREQIDAAMETEEPSAQLESK
ncbi:MULTISPECIES: hypothetical protein [Enterobacter]|uniref:hypothetical protein n=1 Tax=Enterobacter TaxID=547 RepID=UPI001D02CEDE|nr:MULTISPECIES: hypothetical protein [Enterobacter]